MSTSNFPNTLPVAEIWVLFPETDELVVEVRSIWPKGIKPIRGVRSRCFDLKDYPGVLAFRSAVEQHVVEMNKQGFNLYATLNPLRGGLGPSHTANDDDVTCRRRLLIDIDRDSGKDHPASDAEIETASDLADDIKVHLHAQGWATPIQLMSGNGHHLVYPLVDLPTSLEVTASIRECLIALKSKFSRNGFSVDTTVSNPSRVTKLPGTFVRRGAETKDRPYRVARIYE
jgi:hypothetical protein